ncbi:MAG: hypothetical protein WC614_00220 [bacterium]
MNIDKIKHFSEQVTLPSEKERIGKRVVPSETDKSNENEDSSSIKKITFASEEIESEKIKQIKEKIKQGYYNRDDVKKEAIENFLNFLDIRG